MSRVVVIGAGPMGLAAAYQAVLDGHQVDLLEASQVPGGMAGHFDFEGLSLERFYHFVCRTDQPIFDLMAELGIADLMRWTTTTMGLYFGGRMNEWGNPLALLRLRGVGWIAKFRYALFAWVCVHRKRWPALEHLSARTWIVRWCGLEGYNNFWRPLFDYKFYEYADHISAAWMWTRMRRVGKSRKSIMQEQLGYIEGGSETLVNALVHAIESRGGHVHLGNPAKHVTVRQNRVVGVDAAQGHFPADFVISTIPTPQVSGLIPDLPQQDRRRYDEIKNIGICCVVLRLKKPVSPHFWVNISGLPHQIPGVIEFSNLRPFPDAIVYAPYYMPVTDAKFTWSDAKLIDDAFQCLQSLNPALTREDLLASKVSRLRHAQPVCEPGFASKIPPIQTSIEGLQIADTCFYYPEDRGIAESVRLGRDMARQLNAHREP